MTCNIFYQNIKRMKTISNIIQGWVLGLLLLTSCTDYLDKAPESEISATDAYKDYRNFQ